MEKPTVTFCTHDNGSRPYKIELKDGDVHISRDNGKWDADGNHIISYQELMIIKKPLQILIGTHHKGDKESDWGYGNSIIVQETETKWIHIGYRIFSFEPESKIVKYHSHVGNSNVPYPFAIDEDGNQYLMIENLVLSTKEDCHDDPYNYVYFETKSKETRIFPIKNAVLIDKRPGWEDREELHFTPNPRYLTPQI